MLAMSMAVGELALLESNESKRWNSSVSGDSSSVFDFERHIPEKLYSATNLHVWSQLVFGNPVYHPRQLEHIPLVTLDLTAKRHVQLDYNPLERTSYCEPELLAKVEAIPEPLIFNIHYGGQTFVKQLDFSIFARWESVEVLLEGFEGEGAIIEELWDVREDMPIWGGDWDARVYPGLEVDVTCLKSDVWRDDTSCSSDEEDEADDALACGNVQLHGRRWRFGRWRMKVEQESMGAGGVVQDPSRRTILLGALVMATFLGIVSIFCII
jgi:hypothetical protein